jgi:hypothetical protein
MATTQLHVQDVITVKVVTISLFNFSITSVDCTLQHVGSAEWWQA